MVITGDVAVPDNAPFHFWDIPDELLRMPWVLNLAGSITTENLASSGLIYNHTDCVNLIRPIRPTAVFLANNHIDDVPAGIESSMEWSERLGVAHFGAGSNRDDAARPALVSSGGIGYALVGFGWKPVGCTPAGLSSPGVNPLDGENVRRTVEAAMNAHPERRVVAVFHWNYEFEVYPQPGHRELSRRLIDDGVYAVVGHHPHIPGPVERYRGRTIAYSLGNFAFASGRYYGGRLRFPERSFPELVLELNGRGDTLHRLHMLPPFTVQYLGATPVLSPDLGEVAPFEGMSFGEYRAWFRRHRVKRSLLPVYDTAEAGPVNSAKDLWLGIRDWLLRVAVRFNLKSLRR